MRSPDYVSFMADVDLEKFGQLLEKWASSAVSDYGAQAIYLFGSLIYKGGVQFNNSSDVDLVIALPQERDALDRYRWLETFSTHKDALENQLMRFLGRAALLPSASIVAVTDAELSHDIHKDGHRQFFSANTFRNLGNLVESQGILGAKNLSTNRFCAAAIAFTQSIRNEYFAVSANGAPYLTDYDGDDPLPKRFMRAAAMAGRAANLTSGPGSEHDVQEGLDLLSNRLYFLRNTAPLYGELQNLLSVRRKARGKHSPLTAVQQLLLAELIYDIAIGALAPITITPGPTTQTSPQSDVQPSVTADFTKSGSHEEGLETAFVPKLSVMPISSSTAFFAERFASAFPGVRSTMWYNKGPEISTRLLSLLKSPLAFSNGTPVWWWRGGNMHIKSFRKIGGGEYLMDVYELRVARIAAVYNQSYQRQFVYVRTVGSEPTGIYKAKAGETKHVNSFFKHDTEEYARFRDVLLTRDEYDDGFKMIDGTLVPTSGRAELRVRYLSPYNFIIASNGSPINNPSFDFELERMLDMALQRDEENVISELAEKVGLLPLRENRFS